jgi:four helix bundle protein
MHELNTYFQLFIMSYKNLEIWQMSRELTIDIHKMSLTELPKFETYEVGSQIRRSSKSVRANIVEGYGRRKYIQEYIKHMTYSIGSNDETTDHLETLFETASLRNKELFESLHSRLQILGKKINLFLQALERSKNATVTSKQPAIRNQRPITRSEQPATSNQQPATSLQ